MIEERLRDLGFTQNEITVYLTLLRIGEAKAGNVAAEAHMERTSTYNALQRLLAKGMASYVIAANARLFSAADPHKVIDYFVEQQHKAAAVVPELLKVKQFKKEHEVIQKFKGFAGIKTVLCDVLNSCRTNDQYVIMGSSGQLSKYMPVFARIFVARKDAKKLRARILVPASTTGTVQSKYTQARYVPDGVMSPANTTIYKGKVAIIIWEPKPEAILIDNEDIAATYSSYFEFMWKHAKDRCVNN